MEVPTNVINASPDYLLGYRSGSPVLVAPATIGGVAQGGSFTRTYDALGRVASETSSGITYTYTYNALGYLATVSGGGVTRTMVYDTYGREVGETVA